MKIELDFPPAELFPNRAAGTHWGKLYQTKSDYRENSTFLAKYQIRDWRHDGNPIKLTLTFEMPDKRSRDADNCLAASKAALDGLADALQINDKFFEPVEVRRLYVGKKPGKLIVQLGE